MNEDDIVRRFGSVALLEFAGDDGDIVIAETCQRFGRGGGKTLIAFERDDGTSNQGKQCRGIAGTATDLEHDVGLGDLGELQKLGKRRRLHQEARPSAVGGVKRDVGVDIRELLHLRGHELLARHGEEGGQDRVRRHIRGPDLVVHHLGARCFEIHAGALVSG
ncbi:hypothetical protein D9M70_574860 [compost metagenome]